MNYEDKKLLETLNQLVELKVLEKNDDERYNVTKPFDFVFRAHLIVELLHDDDPLRLEDNITYSCVETLEHFKYDFDNVSEDDILLTVRTLRTFEKDGHVASLMKVMAK